MLDLPEIESVWMVEFHVKGWTQIRQVRDVMKDHLSCLMEGRQPDWIAVAVRGDFSEAQKELSKIRKQIREQKQTDPEKKNEL